MIPSRRSANGLPKTIRRLMATFKTWDTVKVQFPYTERPGPEKRAALGIWGGKNQAAHRLLWVLMITSADNRRWDEDEVISDLPRAGLSAASVIRCAKVATID